MKKNLTEAGKRLLAFLCVLAMLITLVPYEAYTVYAEENGKEASPKTEAESAPVVEPKVIAPEVIAPEPPKAEQSAPAPAEAQKPAETPKSTEAAKAAEAPKPTEAPKTEGAKPTDAPKDASKDCRYRFR